MSRVLIAFLALQCLDLITTLVVLSMGGVEKNPLVGFAMAVGPIAGLALSKLIVMAIGGLAAVLRKNRGLRVVNLVFTGVVVWNVTIIYRLALANHVIHL